MSFTPDQQRLKCLMPTEAKSIQATEHIDPQETIKAEVLPGVRHSSVGIQTGHIEKETNYR